MPHPPEAFPLPLLWVDHSLLGGPNHGQRRHPRETHGRGGCPVFLRIGGIVRFAETFRAFPFVHMGNTLVPETADFQPNLVPWRHHTRLKPYFPGSHETSSQFRQYRRSERPAVLNKSQATVQRCKSGPWNQNSAILSLDFYCPQSEGTLNSFHLLIQSRKHQHVSHCHLFQYRWLP